MKKNMLVALIAFLSIPYTVLAQGNPSMGLLEFAIAGIPYDAVKATNVARAELIRLDRFTMLHREDIRYELEQKGIQSQNCFARACLVEVGRTIQARKMFSGTIEAVNGHLLLSMRVIDVASGEEEMSHVDQYLNIPEQLPLMLQMSVRRMFGREVDGLAYQRLTRKDDYESAITLPEATTLNLSGPRMGVGYFAGPLGRTLASSDDGGFDAASVMFQFGYQFEWTYLSEGNFQALFEMVPLITGFDQGKFFPSLSLLNGIRDSRQGWEIAFGPVFNVSRFAEGFYDEQDNFVLKKDRPHGNQRFVRRVDSRGELKVNSGFVISVGRSFRSGRLNLPVNAFFIPGKEGNHRMGISFGYNMRRPRWVVQKWSVVLVWLSSRRVDQVSTRLFLTNGRLPSMKLRPVSTKGDNNRIKRKGSNNNIYMYSIVFL